MKILLAGCGQLGTQLGAKRQQKGDTVVGIKRSTAPTLFELIHIDLSQQNALSELTADYDVIIFTVTPSHRDESAYCQVYTDILQQVIDFAKQHRKPPLCIYVSSTGVYGQNTGEWVDENSPTQPNQYSGKWVLHGENILQEQLSNTLIIRFSGIYNAERRWLINQAITDTPIQKTPTIWTNRIHQADCVGVLDFLLDQYQQGKSLEKCYLASDDAPVGRYEVMAFIRASLGYDEPAIKTDALTQQLNKRCSNKRIKELGYVFSYPTFERGYGEILKQLNN